MAVFYKCIAHICHLYFLNSPTHAQHITYYFVHTYFYGYLFISFVHHFFFKYFSIHLAHKRKIYDNRGTHKLHHSYSDSTNNSSSYTRRGNRYSSGSSYPFRGLFEQTPFYKFFGIVVHKKNRIIIKKKEFTIAKINQMAFT